MKFLKYLVSIGLLILAIYVLIFPIKQLQCENNDALIEREKDVCVTSEGNFYEATLKENKQDSISMAMILFLASILMFMLFSMFDNMYDNSIWRDSK